MMKYLAGLLLALAASQALATDVTVNVEWIAPTENVDGSPLTDLASYKLYGGVTSGVYYASAEIADAQATTASVTLAMPELPMGESTLYIAMTAIDDDGNESAYSNEVTRTVTLVDDIEPNHPQIITITVQVVCPPGVSCLVENP